MLVGYIFLDHVLDIAPSLFRAFQESSYRLRNNLRAFCRLPTGRPEYKHLRVLPEHTSTSREAFPLEREITFWHLLTHTAGLGYGIDAEPTEPIEVIYRDANLMSPLLSLQSPLQELVRVDG